jgi:UDP-N-acetylglucosamine transferase subunit ALG13
LAFQAGKVPVLVPRRQHRNEHVDDHQTQIAAELARRGLAVSSEVDQLDLEDLMAASRARIKKVENVPALMLRPPV